VLRIDGIQVGGKFRILLKPRVDAMDCSVEFVCVAKHLGAGSIVSQITEIWIVPFFLEPVSEGL